MLAAKPVIGVPGHTAEALRAATRMSQVEYTTRIYNAYSAAALQRSSSQQRIMVAGFVRVRRVHGDRVAARGHVSARIVESCGAARRCHHRGGRPGCGGEQRQQQLEASPDAANK